MQREKRIVWIDAIKIVGMILVILLHVMGNTINTFGLNGDALVVYNVLIALSNVCIPIFIMVSGFLLLNHKREITFKEMLKKYVLKVLLILLVFGTSFIMLEEYFITRTFSISMIGTVFRRLLTGEVWAHMWYLYMLLGLYLITPFIKILVKNISRENFVYLLAVLYFLTIFIPDIKFSLGLEINLYMFGTPFLFYYLLGYYLGTYDFSEKQNLIIYIIGLFSIVMVLINYIDGYNYISQTYGTTYLIILATSLFLLFKNAKIKTKLDKLIASLGECSLGIYILHQFYINIVYKLIEFDLILDHPYVGLVLYTLVIFIVTYGTVFLLRMIKPLKKIL